jgi:hypothetical protein
MRFLETRLRVLSHPVSSRSQPSAEVHQVSLYLHSIK